MTNDAPATPQQSAAPSSGWSWFRFTRNAVIIAAVVGLGAWYGVVGVYPNIVPKNFGVVEEGVLYRAGRLTPAATAKVVERHGIRTIVDLGGWDRLPKAHARAVRTAESLGVRRVDLPLIGDARGDPNRYAEALRIIEDPANQPVLVHCAAGSERTGCLVGLFRIRHDGYTVEDVMAESQTFRHDPQKNPNMRTMLETWSGAVFESVETGVAISYEGDINDAIPVAGLEDDEIGRPPSDSDADGPTP